MALTIPKAEIPTKLPSPANNNPKSTFGNTMVNSSGFYYDQQKKNELISVSLHPNRVTSDFGQNWEMSSEPRDTDGYRMRPICTAIMAEDYQVAVSNSWTDLGDDMLRQLWSQYQPAAPYLDQMLESVKEMNEKGEEATREDELVAESNVAQFLMKITNLVEGGLEIAKHYTNKGIVSKKLARMTYYQGTGVGFGNLTLKFTVFADWIDGKFQSCNDQLLELYPYCFGVLSNEKIQNTGGKNKDADFLIDKANEFFSWQNPPGGFEADIKTIDSVNVGTLKLKFGAYYMIDNLVVSDAQFQFSKQMAKYIEAQGDPNNISPLFCDVVLTLKPATKFTDSRLKEILSGDKMSTEREAMETILSDNLEKEKDKITKLMGN